VHASLTTVRDGGPDVGQTARMAAESMLSWLREFDGYRGLLVFADASSGTARIMTLWDSRQALERSERARTQVRESMVAAAGAAIESVERYELVLDDRS
jgi:hypothetical protein